MVDRSNLVASSPWQGLSPGEQQEKASTSGPFSPCTRVKISADGVVQTERIITTSVIEPSKKLPCEIRGCGRYFGNKGA